MKEQKDCLELEFKFHSLHSDEQLLSTIRPILPEGFVILREATTANHDIYLDTGCYCLLRLGSSLRLRKRRRRKGWTLNFKSPDRSAEEYVQRQETITTFNPDEVQVSGISKLPGLAASRAYEFIRSNQEAINPLASNLLPIIHMISCRRTYYIGLGSIDELYKNRNAPVGFRNLLCLHIDEVTTIDVRDRDIRPLMHLGFVDYSKPMCTPQFNLVEIELAHNLSTQFPNGPWSHLFLQVGCQLKSLGIIYTRKSKYQMGMESLPDAQLLERPLKPDIKD